jgi:outer membrane protein OmpA-like peptidoglycan-associated protein
MARFALPLLALAGLALLGFLCVNSHVPAIEADLTSRATQALASAGIPLVAPASIGFPGRLVAKLRGYEGSREIGPEAQAAVLSVWGVTGVEIEAIPRPAADVAKTEITEVLKLENIEFLTAKADLTPRGQTTLDHVAAILAKLPNAVAIGGHTDSQGRDEANLRLSQARAETTRAYLVTKGIAADRLTATGYGATRPIADNTTQEGRQRNRRIEFDVKQ